MYLFAWLPVVATTLWITAGLIAVLLLTRRRLRAPQAPLPAVSVLKPLCGRDADLEANLESFFQQDHGKIELLFGVTDARDPAVEVARSLAARYPNVSPHRPSYDLSEHP